MRREPNDTDTNVLRALQGELEQVLDKATATGILTAPEIEEWVKECLAQWEGWPDEESAAASRSGEGSEG